MARRIYVAPGDVRISRAGFDVFTAGDDQLHLKVGKYPMQMMKSGYLLVPAGGAAAALFGYTLPYVPIVLFQSSSASAAQYPRNGDHSGIPGATFSQPIYRLLEAWRVAFTQSDTVTRGVGYIVFRRTNNG